MARIVLYSQPGCPSCQTAKEFLSAHGAQYEERNIRQDAEFLRELVEDLDSRTTPTLVVDSHVIMGFDAEKYESALSGNSK
ncbi:MAG: glutaredoxin family protein [Bryobacteraceae bacterium]